jgi:hypothetical protein
MLREIMNKEFPRLYASVGTKQDVVVQHIEEFAKYDIMTMYGSRKEEFKRIKAANPQAVVLHYLNVTDLSQSPGFTRSERSTRIGC